MTRSVSSLSFDNVFSEFSCSSAGSGSLRVPNNGASLSARPSVDELTTCKELIQTAIQNAQERQANAPIAELSKKVSILHRPSSHTAAKNSSINWKKAVLITLLALGALVATAVFAKFMISALPLLAVIGLSVLLLAGFGFMLYGLGKGDLE